MSPVDGVSATVLATWSLAAECAHDLPPTALAWPTLVLAAMLDHHGIPGTVLTSPAACSYITGRPSTAGGADQNMVRAAINNLAAVGLVTIDPASPVRTVRCTPASRPRCGPGCPRPTWSRSRWPPRTRCWRPGRKPRAGRQLEQALRDCTAALRANDGGVLWKTEAHPLLFRAGLSLENSRLSEAAIAYWQSIVATSTRLLGSAHANAVVARDRLAAAYEAAGRSGRGDLGVRGGAGRPGAEPGTRAPGDHRRPRSPGPRLYQRRAGPARPWPCTSGRWPTPSGCSARATRSPSTRGPAWPPPTRAPGSSREAVSGYELLLADAEHLLGPGHPTTLGARASLAAAYAANGQAKDAISQYERALADQERMHGRDHPDAIAARAALASAYRSAGKLKEAIGQYERVLGRPGAGRGRRPSGHDRGPGQPGLRLPQRRPAARGCPGLRAHARRPGAGPGSGSPGHPDRTLEPGRVLPAGAAG